MVKIDDFSFDTIHFAQSALYLNAQFFKHQFGNGTACHTCSGLSGRTSPSAAVVSQAIFVKIGEVGMPRTEEVFDIVIVLALLVGVEDDHCNGCTGAQTFEDTGEYLYLVIFLAPCLQIALPRLSSVKLGLNEGFIYFKTGRYTVEYAPYRFSVGFPKRSECQFLSKRIHVLPFQFL